MLATRQGVWRAHPPPLAGPRARAPAPCEVAAWAPAQPAAPAHQRTHAAPAMVLRATPPPRARAGTAARAQQRPQPTAARELLVEPLARAPLLGRLLAGGSSSFAFTIDCHARLHDAVCAVVPLERAPTAVSDDDGVLLRRAGGVDATPDAPVLRVQTLRPAAGAGSSAQLVAHAHHTFAAAPGYAYSKSSIFTADASTVPHLELEMGCGSGSSALLYLSLDPRLSPTLHPEYLDRVYNGAPPRPQHAGGNASASAGPASSWRELEARAAGCPGFARFTSPSLHVRAFSATAILFQVEPEGWDAARSVLADGVAIWLAWLQSGGSESVSLDELAARSWAWRRFPRREGKAAMMQHVFGAEAMEDFWDSMAGEPRLWP